MPSAAGHEECGAEAVELRCLRMRDVAAGGDETRSKAGRRSGVVDIVRDRLEIVLILVAELWPDDSVPASRSEWKHPPEPGHSASLPPM